MAHVLMTEPLCSELWILILTIWAGVRTQMFPSRESTWPGQVASRTAAHFCSPFHSVLHGLKNEALWQLIRRFNNVSRASYKRGAARANPHICCLQQVTHVKALDEPPLAGIDMNIADEVSAAYS